METCKNCGAGVFEIVPVKKGPHYAKMVCANCGAFVKWVPKPCGEKRRISSRFSVEDIARHRGFEKPFCFFCGRTQEQLGVRETLTVDHILPVSEGGEDVIENVQILCTACHKLKNWITLYVRKHIFEEGVEDV